MEQEKSVGAYYTVDVEIETDFHAAMKNDELDGTIDYSEVYKIICDEMSAPSKLIENVSYRIISKIFTNFSKAKNVVLKILKENPPMGAECLGAGVEIDIDREEFLLL